MLTMRLQAPFLLLLTCVAATKGEDSVFLWSSTGGGWRAQFACVGFSNVFQQAGLFTETSSKFRSIVSETVRLHLLFCTYMSSSRLISFHL